MIGRYFLNVIAETGTLILKLDIISLKMTFQLLHMHNVQYKNC